MHGLNLSRRTVDFMEILAAGGFATALILVSVITAATLLYAWFLA
jgi:hypothetical protein